MKTPTPADDAWAKVVETAAQALAEHRGDDCFGPLRDTYEYQQVRDRFRAEVRAVLDAVNHRGYRDEVAKVDAVLHDYGWDYPQGARGVADAFGQYVGRLNDPDYLRAALAGWEADGG